MQIKEQWRYLISDNKFGVGVQGIDGLAELEALNPAKVLYMDNNLDTYAEKYGSRGALRLYHGTEKNWKDADGWAKHCAYHLSRCYDFGVRDVQPINEVWGLEGLGDQEEDYRWMGEEWTPAFLDAFVRHCHDFNIPVHPEPDGARLWFFGPSPGHNYEDNFVGLRHLAKVFADERIFGSIEHYYWEFLSGFLDDPDFYYNGPGRLLLVRGKMLELGIDKPVWIGEFNRKVARNDPDDVLRYIEQIKQFMAWVNDLDFVVWATYFLYNCNEDSTDFYDLTLRLMSGAVDKLTEWTDRGTLPEPELDPIPEPEPKSLYQQWSEERINNGQDDKDLDAFKEHLLAIGVDPNLYIEYGWVEQKSLFQLWVEIREVNGQDPNDLTAFQEHLKAIGCDPDLYLEYGWMLIPERKTLYELWAEARTANGQSATSLIAFKRHLKAIGADPTLYIEHGWPFEAPVPVPEPVPVFSFLDTEGVDIGVLLQETSIKYELPLVALVALGKAESEWFTKAERYGYYSNNAKAVIEEVFQTQDWTRLQYWINLAWPDVSFGYSQMIVSTAAGYGIGNGSSNVNNVLLVRESLFDRSLAIDVMCKHYQGCYLKAKQVNSSAEGDDLILLGMVAYNAGYPYEFGSWYYDKYAGNFLRYQQCLVWAHGIVDK